MDWERADSLMEYWGEYPPTHVLLRHFVGYKGGHAPASDADALADVHELLELGGA